MKLLMAQFNTRAVEDTTPIYQKVSKHLWLLLKKPGGALSWLKACKVK